MIARLLVSYTETTFNRHGTIGVDIDNYDTLTASEVLDAIIAKIDEGYAWDATNSIQLTSVVELQPRRPVTMRRPSIGYRAECIACGKENGHGGLPCPTMTPMA